MLAKKYVSSVLGTFQKKTETISFLSILLKCLKSVEMRFSFKESPVFSKVFITLEKFIKKGTFFHKFFCR